MMANNVTGTGNIPTGEPETAKQTVNIAPALKKAIRERYVEINGEGSDSSLGHALGADEFAAGAVEGSV